MKLATVSRNQNRIDPFQHLVNELMPRTTRTAIKPVGSSRAAINILEYDDRFELKIAIPGFAKDNFEIRVEEDHLKVGFKLPEDNTAQVKNFVRREFTYESFDRSWELTDDIDQESIQANYEGGILQLTLGKKEAAKKPAPKAIEIL